jgi:hypothetical protein
MNRVRVSPLPGAVLALCVVAVPGARAQVADSSFIHYELGAASDVTNEQFYEATFDDTTLTGRHLASSPEVRAAVVGAVEGAGRFARGPYAWFREEATYGDKLKRSYTRFDLSGTPQRGLRLSLSPQLDLRHDRSFGDDRRELEFQPDARMRVTSLGRSNLLDLLVGGDWFRSQGTSELVTLDRNAGRAWLRWSRAPLASRWDTELGYGADVRAFPDSTNRDHVEQHGAVTLRGVLPGATSATLDAQVDRRSPIHATPSTRDRFWSGHGDGTVFVPLHERLTAELWLTLDGYAYDEPDTSVYFDYSLVSAQPSLHWSLAHDWAVRVGPRFEQLLAPDVPDERYREYELVLEGEWLHASDWLSLSPTAGWREYERSSSTLSLAEPDLHSSYLFVGGEAFGDLALPGRTRLRFSGSARFESHDDPSQDANSLYFSIDFRRAF